MEHSSTHNKKSTSKVWQLVSTASQSRTISLLVLLLILAAVPLTVFVAGQIQDLRQRADTGPTKNISITGKVTEGTSQQGVAGVTVRLMKKNQNQEYIQIAADNSESGTGNYTITATVGSGSYKFEAVSNNDYTVTTPPFAQDNLTLDQILESYTDVNFQVDSVDIDREFTINGKVFMKVNTTEQGVTNISVRLLKRTSGSSYTPVASATSQDGDGQNKGNYTIAVTTGDGSYKLEVVPTSDYTPVTAPIIADNVRVRDITDTTLNNANFEVRQVRTSFTVSGVVKFVDQSDRDITANWKNLLDGKKINGGALGNIDINKNDGTFSKSGVAYNQQYTLTPPGIDGFTVSPPNATCQSAGECNNTINFTYKINENCPTGELNPTASSRRSGDKTYVTLSWADILREIPDSQKDYRIRVTDYAPGHSIKIDGDSIASNCDEAARNTLDICKDGWTSNSMILDANTPATNAVTYSWWMHAVKQSCPVITSGVAFTVQPQRTGGPSSTPSVTTTTSPNPSTTPGASTSPTPSARPTEALNVSFSGAQVTNYNGGTNSDGSIYNPAKFSITFNDTDNISGERQVELFVNDSNQYRKVATEDLNYTKSGSTTSYAKTFTAINETFSSTTTSRPNKWKVKVTVENKTKESLDYTFVIPLVTMTGFVYADLTNNGLTQDDQKVGGAEITLYKLEGSTYRRVKTVSTFSTNDENNGTFLASALSAGNYSVRVTGLPSNFANFDTEEDPTFDIGYSSVDNVQIKIIPRQLISRTPTPSISPTAGSGSGTPTSTQSQLPDRPHGDMDGDGAIDILFDYNAWLDVYKGIRANGDDSSSEGRPNDPNACSTTANTQGRFIHKQNDRICADVILPAGTGIEDFQVWNSAFRGTAATPTPTR